MHSEVKNTYTGSSLTAACRLQKHKIPHWLQQGAYPKLGRIIPWAHLIYYHTSSNENQIYCTLFITHILLTATVDSNRYCTPWKFTFQNGNCCLVPKSWTQLLLHLNSMSLIFDHMIKFFTQCRRQGSPGPTSCQDTGDDTLSISLAGSKSNWGFVVILSIGKLFCNDYYYVWSP